MADLASNLSTSPPSASDASASAAAAKKPHPIPWTHDETISLIRAYQDKWYSLKRGPLKASQWEEVAAAVAARCRFSSKTGTQCRHKIEKLRKRYRAEKLRPNPSAWPYFDLMRQLEIGPLPISVALPVATLNRQPDFDDDDDDEDEDDYAGEFAKRRRIEQPRVSADPRLDQFGQMVEGFLKNGKKLGDSDHRDPKLRHYSNPNLTDPRFQKNKLPYDSDSDSEEAEAPKRRSDMMLGELALQMRGFAERFMKLERKKMEVMRETERYRMEMENKRMEMILVAQQKTVDMISRAFAASPSPSPSSSSQSDKKLQHMVEVSDTVLPGSVRDDEDDEGDE